MATIRTIERKRGTVYKAIVRTHGQTLSRTFDTKSDAAKWGKQTEQALQRESSGLVSEGHRSKSAWGERGRRRSKSAAGAPPRRRSP